MVFGTAAREITEKFAEANALPLAILLASTLMAMLVKGRTKSKELGSFSHVPEIGIPESHIHVYVYTGLDICYNQNVTIWSLHLKPEFGTGGFGLSGVNSQAHDLLSSSFRFARFVRFS